MKPWTGDRGPGAALVLSTTRRKATLLCAGGELVTLHITAKVPGVAPGDYVMHDQAGISNVLPRKNCLVRTYRGQTKELAANLDMLYIVTAILPLFNTIFVDRVIAVCELRGIPYSLVVNKVDLGPEAAEPVTAIYDRLQVPILLTSAKTDEGLRPLALQLERCESRIVALAGTSGVGKSSILNRLVPEANRKTAELSRKTGKGRQTTSQAVGYVYDRADALSLIIDLPGLQHFGAAFLAKSEAARGFREITRAAADCEYADCSHTAEPNCAVKAAAERGEIAPTRYLSYLHILDEIEAAKPY